MGSQSSNSGWECTCVHIRSFIPVRLLSLHCRLLREPSFAIVHLPQIDLDPYRICLFQNPISGSLLYTSLSLVFGTRDSHGDHCNWIEPVVLRSRGVRYRLHTDTGVENPAL